MVELPVARGPVLLVLGAVGARPVHERPAVLDRLRPGRLGGPDRSRARHHIPSILCRGQYVMAE
eukprot:5267537-Pyramimonas_sp.AAC.1